MRQERDNIETTCTDSVKMERVVGGKYVSLPLYLKFSNDPTQIAKYFATKYKKAKRDNQRDKVLRGLLVSGSMFDAVVRSIVLYPTFEDVVGQRFPGLWRKL